MKTQDYIALEERYGAHNYHPLDVVITRGEGVCACTRRRPFWRDCSVRREKNLNTKDTKESFFFRLSFVTFVSFVFGF